LSLVEATSFAEIAAALATISTLVYLAIQIRANTTVQKAEARRAIQDTTNDYSSIIGQSKETAKVFTDGLMSFDTLDEYERMQFFFLMAMIVGLCDQTYADFRLKIIEEDLWVTGRASVSRMLKTPGGRAFWEINSSSYGPEFQNYVSTQVYESKSK
jgi:hypothetical protein